MLPLYSSTQARALDSYAVEQLGLPSFALMENAGRGAADIITTRYPERLERVVIVGGPGNNGGDGWVLARHLRLRGHTPHCFLVGQEAEVKGDAFLALRALKVSGVEVHASQTLDQDFQTRIASRISWATLVVDALFGTGLTRSVEGIYKEVIEQLARVTPCVALDMPSGVDASTGAVLGTAVRASLTITFGAHKMGLHQFPGAAHAGEVVCTSIGVAPSIPTASYLLQDSDSSWVPMRASDAHKGTAGKVGLLAGSIGKTGAALLCARGAFRSGAGLVTLFCRAEAQARIEGSLVELMTEALPAEPQAAANFALQRLGTMDAVVLGPGFGLDPWGTQILRLLAKRLDAPTVLDADALNAWGAQAEELKSAQGPRILTPHPGEAAALLGVSAEEVQKDRYASATQLAKRTGAIVVLKGARTVITSPDGKLCVCPRGSTAMAVAGSGDVLSGAIASLLKHVAPFEAACAGAYLHAVAGEIASTSDRGLLAHELADALPRALEGLRKSRES